MYILSHDMLILVPDILFITSAELLFLVIPLLVWDGWLIVIKDFFSSGRCKILEQSMELEGLSDEQVSARRSHHSLQSTIHR